jgi:hypothetical protein
VEVRIENRTPKPEFIEVEPLDRERALSMQL